MLVPLGFDAQKLIDNYKTLIGAILKAKPVATKGSYLKSISISSTMGPGIKLDLEQELSKLFAIYEKLQLRSPGEVAEDQQKFQTLVQQFIASKND